MTTSGTINFNLDIADIIEEAISQIGGEVTLGDDPREARRSLDLLLREWQNRGYSLWKTDLNTISLTQGFDSFSMPSNVIDVLIATIRQNNNDIELTRLTMEEYEKVPNKSSTGKPTQYAIQSTTADGPTIYFWPVPDQTNEYTVRYRYFGYTQDNSASRYNADVPTHMLPALTAGLAFKMSLKRPGIPESRIALLKGIYDQIFDEAFTSDRERESLFIKPFFRV